MPTTGKYLSHTSPPSIPTQYEKCGNILNLKGPSHQIRMVYESILYVAEQVPKYQVKL
jgi:hypothetical protein